MITYKNFGSERIEEVKSLFREEGWNAYLRDDEALVRAFDNSLSRLGAFDEEDRLVAFIRCVGDGEHIVMVQDLIVSREYRRKGIGSALFRSAWESFKHVRMFQVLTDIEDEADNSFYRSFGMRELKEGNMISYFR